MLFRYVRLFVISLGIFASAIAAVEASCGCASCPLDTRSELQNEKGQVRIGYEFEYIDQNQPRIGTTKASVGELPGHHDEQRSINRLHRMTGTVGVTDRFSLDLGLPVISRSHRHIHNHRGVPNIEGWDYAGVGDLQVQGRYAFYKSNDPSLPTLSAIAGMEFPTGKSQVTNDEAQDAEPSMTPGSASYDFIVGGVSLQTFTVPTVRSESASMPLFVSLTYKINGKGHDDYRIGNQLSANLGVSYPVIKSMSLLSQINLLVKEKDKQGLTSEDVEKTGGEFLYYSPGIQIRLADAWEWSTLVQVPLHQRVNEIQLTSNYNLLSRVSYRFHL